MFSTEYLFNKYLYEKMRRKIKRVEKVKEEEKGNENSKMFQIALVSRKSSSVCVCHMERKNKVC